MPSTFQLGALGAVVALIIGLITALYVSHERNLALTAQLSTCTVANTDFAKQVKDLTADAAAARTKAAQDHADLVAHTQQSADDLARKKKEIDSVATPDDDRISAALGDAFKLMRRTAAGTAPAKN